MNYNYCNKFFIWETNSKIFMSVVQFGEMNAFIAEFVCFMALLPYCKVHNQSTSENVFIQKSGKNVKIIYFHIK